MRFLLRNNIVMRIDSALADQGKPYTFMVSLKTPHQYSLSFPPGSINPELARPLQTAIREYTERQTALSQKIDTCVQNPSASLAQTLGKPKIEPDFVCSADEGRKARARATEGQALMQKNLGN
jgi:hypothetical protein